MEMKAISVCLASVYLRRKFHDFLNIQVNVTINAYILESYNYLCLNRHYSWFLLEFSLRAFFVTKSRKIKFHEMPFDGCYHIIYLQDVLLEHHPVRKKKYSYVLVNCIVGCFMTRYENKSSQMAWLYRGSCENYRFTAMGYCMFVVRNRWSNLCFSHFVDILNEQFRTAL